MAENAEYDKIYKTASDLTTAIQSELDLKPGDLENFVNKKACYLELNDPTKQHQMKFGNGVDYIFDGHHDDGMKKFFPGAKNKALQRLAKAKTGKGDVLEDKEEAMGIVSEYIDEVLKHYYGEEGFEIYKEKIKELEKFKKQPHEIFEHKVAEFNAIAGTDPKGNRISIEGMLEDILGKTKTEAESTIKASSDSYKQAYMVGQFRTVTSKYVDQKDHNHWYKSTQVIAKEKGLEQVDVIAGKSAGALAATVSGFHHNLIPDDKISKHGFKRKKDSGSEE
ncbi:MAG: hypothetical protein KKE20_05895 [Nanoarchaeota archaeon]|nr:hypothetical protein [Nanoarchaeota archaeon]